MRKSFDPLQMIPGLAHAAAGALHAVARRRPASAESSGGMLDADWAIGGVSWPVLPVYGQGVFRARAAVLTLPAAAVQALLPEGLTLATADADGTHPVVLFFGEQSDVRANLWPFPGWRYHEAVVAVPDVQALDPQQEYQGPFAFMPRLWLDRELPVLAGVLGYAYPKRLERIADDGHRYTVVDDGGVLLADARFAPAGPPRPPADFAAWPVIERLLDQPLLGERRTGAQIGSVLTFRTQQLRSITPLNASIRLADGAVPGFAGGDFTASGIAGLPAAFAFESHWRITPPMPRGCFRPAAPTHPQPAQDAGNIAWTRPRRRKIAVLGGGVGAMTAVWALTRDAGWQDLYDITVYQTGWRLGGKGANGRNAAMGQRIEEHGLHIWAGFYENAFRMMRDVYGELGRPAGSPLATVADAFRPHQRVTIEDNASGAWQGVTMNIPPMPGEPGEGDPLIPANPLEYLPTLIGLIDMWTQQAHPDVATALHRHAVRGSSRSKLAVAAARAAGHATGRPDSVLDAARAVALHAVQPGRHRLMQIPALLFHARAAQRAVAASRTGAGRGAGGAADWDGMQHLAYCAIDLGIATVIGILADGLFWRGFAAADDMEWCDWLRRHGARPEAVDSAMVRATYDYVFGFGGGDTAVYALAAGTTTHGVLRLMLTYRGAFFWAMQAGMGDTIFAPLHSVLEKRGVTFKYFHRTSALRLNANHTEIETIEMAEQARLIDPAAGYQPFVVVNGLDSWPSTPRFEQLQDGEALYNADLEHADGPLAKYKTLTRGEDFHEVILGISLGALKDICGDLMAASPRWQAMVDKVKTVATFGIQLWTTPDLAGLGWQDGNSIVTAYAEPLDTWADMDWLLPREAWPGPQQPGSVLYLCGTLADAAVNAVTGGTDGMAQTTAQETAIARQTAADWLQDNAGHPWPLASNGRALDYRVLYAPGAATPQQQFDAQYFRANTRGSERYVQTVPGATTARLRPGESGFDNLFLAGDWVRSGMSAGCVEGAAMGGLGAAAALSGQRIDIVDDETVPLAESLMEHIADAVHPVALTDAVLMALHLPHARVAALLPPGLSLAPQALAPQGEAPVLLVLARHRHARLTGLPFGLGFRELLVIVPATRLSDRARRFGLPGPYGYVARRYADCRTALGLAHALYGEPGQRGRFQGDSVATAGGAPLFALSATPLGHRVRAAAATPFAEIDWLLSRPLISKRGSDWRVSRLDWRLAQASVQGLTVSLSVQPALGLGGQGQPLRLDSGMPGLIGALRIWTETARSNPLLGRRAAVA